MFKCEAETMLPGRKVHVEALFFFGDCTLLDVKPRDLAFAQCVLSTLGAGEPQRSTNSLLGSLGTTHSQRFDLRRAV